MLNLLKNDVKLIKKYIGEVIKFCGPLSLTTQKQLIIYRWNFVTIIKDILKKL